MLFRGFGKLLPLQVSCKNVFLILILPESSEILRGIFLSSLARVQAQIYISLLPWIYAWNSASQKRTDEILISGLVIVYGCWSIEFIDAKRSFYWCYFPSSAVVPFHLLSFNSFTDSIESCYFLSCVGSSEKLVALKNDCWTGEALPSTRWKIKFVQ